ncbi:MAG: metalloregulator ArsR/SmtB family transcription factor [Spirochaetaceae bacterium]|nr:metalloregulator ArsR/SmtB family transcription factor [Spirochaetaceae bacterium]
MVKKEKQKEIIEDEYCECNVIHKDTVKLVEKQMPKEELMFELADFFKMFSDSTRIKIICALLNSELCVCDIAYLLKMTKSAISHQLRSLRQTKLVRFRREGNIIFYSLDDEHIKNILYQGIEHINE